MKYVCLGYIDQTQWEALSEGERDALIEECFAYDDLLRANGHFLGGEALANAGDAATLRWRNGGVTVTDGPFAETKEQLGGILLLEADDLNHAIQLMSSHPGVRLGGPFEIRPADEQVNARIAARHGSATVAPGGGSPASVPQKITTFLWFDDDAEEAMELYVSIFDNSKILDVTRYGDSGPGRKGTVMTGTFQLEGQRFIALNGGPRFKFTEAVSLLVSCASQQEIDELWAKLTADGGEPSRCGWLKDRFGLSWQIVPTVLWELLSDRDAARSRRVTEALLQMGKIDIGLLRRAYDGQARAAT